MYNGADKRNEQTGSVQVSSIENVKLTARQQLFVESYLANGCRSSAEAIKQAGYKGTNCYVAASCMLRKPNVKKYLRLRKTQMLKEAGVQSYNLLLELAAIAFGDIRELYNDDNTLKDIKTLSKQTAAALESVEVDEIRGEYGEVVGYTKKVKMSSKLKAIELLMRFKGMFDKDNAGNQINLTNFSVSLDLGGNTPALIVSENK